MIEGSLKGKDVKVVKPCPVLRNLASNRTESILADQSLPSLYDAMSDRPPNLTSRPVYSPYASLHV